MPFLIKATGQKSMAVATLEEVHRLVGRTVRERSEGSYEDWCAAYPLTLEADDIPESGGTVGPLPDGTLIEVEQRQWYELALDVGWDFHRDAHRDEAELLAAYNAREAVS